MRDRSRSPAVMMTSAHNGEGVKELVDWLEGYYDKVQHEGRLQNRRQSQRIDRIKRAAKLIINRRFMAEVGSERIEAAEKSHLPVRDAARQLVEEFLSGQIINN